MKSREPPYMSLCEANSYFSPSTAAWESENDVPVAEWMEDICNALDRLERRDSSENNKANRDAISV
jgi:hypothetical protein